MFYVITGTTTLSRPVVDGVLTLNPCLHLFSVGRDPHGQECVDRVKGCRKYLKTLIIFCM